MTPEEYLKIKQKEAAHLKNMNFGAFGLRFLQTRRPSGDWFLTPSLWTGGYNLNLCMAVDGDNKGDSLFAGIKDFFKKWGPALFLSYLAVDVGITMEVLYRLTGMKPRQNIAMFLKVFVWAKHNNMWLAWYKAHLTKCAISAVLVYPMQKYIDYAKEKWSWTRKRTAVLITSGVLFGLSLSWSLTLLVLKKIGVNGA